MSKRYEAQVLVIPFGGQTALTVVLRQDKTGHILHATTGDCTASIPFASGRIQATRHAQSGDWLVLIPATDVKTLYGTLYHKSLAEVTKDTIPDTPSAAAFLFDASTGSSFSDLLPIRNGRVMTE